MAFGGKVVAAAVGTPALEQPLWATAGAAWEGDNPILLDPAHQEMGMRCEMLLYMAARAQMMVQMINTFKPQAPDQICILSDPVGYQTHD